MPIALIRFTWTFFAASAGIVSCSYYPATSSNSGPDADVKQIKKLETRYWRNFDPEVFVTVDGDIAGAYFNLGIGPGTSVYRRIDGHWKHIASYNTVPGPCQFTEVGIAAEPASEIVEEMEKTINYHLDDNPRTPSCVQLPEVNVRK